MATYRFPAASPSTSAVDMLLKGIALSRQGRQDEREAALNELRLKQTQQGIDLGAMQMDEARRALDVEQAGRSVLPLALAHGAPPRAPGAGPPRRAGANRHGADAIGTPGSRGRARALREVRTEQGGPDVLGAEQGAQRRRDRQAPARRQGEGR